VTAIIQTLLLLIAVLVVVAIVARQLHTLAGYLEAINLFEVAYMVPALSGLPWG
jgi:hypothetical protein